jgi:hypothetical protein
MIEPLLFFVLGLFVAALIWLLLLPAFWRRATRLARQALEQSLPLTPNEIAAERDGLRARFAVEAAQAARREEKTRAELASARAETGDRLREEAGYIEALAASERRFGEREAELAALSERVVVLEAELAALRVAHKISETSLSGILFQRDALLASQSAALELAEERRLHLEEKGCEAANLRAALAEETRHAAELRAELHGRTMLPREAGRSGAQPENDIALARIPRGEISSENANLPREQGLRAG